MFPTEFLSWHGGFIDSSYIFQIHSTFDSILSIDGIQFFKNLEGIRIQQNCINEIPEFPQNNSLRFLSCINCCISNFNPSNYPNLYYLNINKNPLNQNLDLSNNLSLEFFFCADCDLLEYPNISSNNLLKYINLSINNINSDFSLNSHPLLEFFECSLCNLNNFPDISSNMELKNLQLNDNNIKNLPNLVNHNKIASLNISNNKIKKISQIIHLNSLEHFIFGGNEVEYFPWVLNLENLMVIFANDNQLTQAPELAPAFFRPYPFFFIYNIRNNEIKELPNFQPYYDYLIEHGAIDLRENRLDFSDAYQIKYLDSVIGINNQSSTNYGLDVYPQKPFGIKDTFHFPLQTDTFISIKSQEYATHYQWFKNGVPIDGATDTILHFYYIQPNDEGVYTCKSYSDYLTNMRLIDDITEFESETKTLRTTPTIQDKSLIKVYPNPTAQSINFDLYILKEKSEVQIYYSDILGKKVKLHQSKENRGLSKLNFDVSHLSSGIYLFEIKIDEKKHIKKVLIVD